MHIHILGICGTFMGSLAVLAKQMGFTVTGSDQHVYPPMSTQLQEQGIAICEADDLSLLQQHPDCVIIGNALSRGNAAVEFVLRHQIPYMSGPQWLAQHILQDRWVLAVAGTHGKTTTASMLAWILEYTGCAPGFLIGGIPENFGTSARLGDEPYFVIEADEYDSAFFDKRSKFIHYQARTLILNNLEYDHADIFPDLAAIQTQFKHLIRTIPDNGLIICPDDDAKLTEVLEKECWTPLETFSIHDGLWCASDIAADGSHFQVSYQGTLYGEVAWPLLGMHNIKNALAAIAASHHVGVPIAHSIEALSEFINVKRRLEVRGKVRGITVYDDFAHHPSAIATTLDGVRQHIQAERLIAVIEFASNTMSSGIHNTAIAKAIQAADIIYFKQPQSQWRVETLAQSIDKPIFTHETADAIVEALALRAKTGDHIVIMSNKSFENIHQKLLTALEFESNEEEIH